MNLAQHFTAAEALAAALPTTSQVKPVPVSSQITPSADIIGASFVGSPSADMAIALLDPSDVSGAGGNPGLVSLPDVLRPALEAASATLGTGVLGDATPSESNPLFSDAEAAAFELKAGDRTIGYFALRVRETVTTRGFQPMEIPGIGGRLNRINDVEMSLTVVIGRTVMPVRDVLNMEPGAVIELDRSAGEPADVLLNNKLIARGEVVVVDQDYAVRITKILDVAGLN